MTTLNEFESVGELEIADGATERVISNPITSIENIEQYAFALR